MLLGAAQGIAAAHEAGLVHRDVKPENVLITRDGRAIVTDFGLARTEDSIDPNASTLSTDPHLTATGAIAGTPAYIAPEQLTGDPIDARVDQFAWAVMAWELLVGARPFPIVFAARIEAVQHGVTPPPRRCRSTLGTALARRCRTSPRDRFPSMRELIEAMRDAVAPQTTADCRARRRPRSKRGPAIAGLAVLGATAIAIGAWVFARGPAARRRRSSPDPSPAVAHHRATPQAADAVQRPHRRCRPRRRPAVARTRARAGRGREGRSRRKAATPKQHPAVAPAPKTSPQQTPPPGEDDVAQSNAAPSRR